MSTGPNLLFNLLDCWSFQEKIVPVKPVQIKNGKFSGRDKLDGEANVIYSVKGHCWDWMSLVSFIQFSSDSPNLVSYICIPWDTLVIWWNEQSKSVFQRWTIFLKKPNSKVVLRIVTTSKGSFYWSTSLSLFLFKFLNVNSKTRCPNNFITPPGTCMKETIKLES